MLFILMINAFGIIHYLINTHTIHEQYGIYLSIIQFCWGLQVQRHHKDVVCSWDRTNILMPCITAQSTELRKLFFFKTTTLNASHISTKNHFPLSLRFFRTFILILQQPLFAFAWRWLNWIFERIGSLIGIWQNLVASKLITVEIHWRVLMKCNDDNFVNGEGRRETNVYVVKKGCVVCAWVEIHRKKLKASYAEFKLDFELGFKIKFELEFELEFEWCLKLEFELKFKLELELHFEMELKLLSVVEKEKSTLKNTQNASPQYILSVNGKLGLFELNFKWTVPVSSNDQLTQFLKVAKLYAGQIFKMQIDRWIDELFVVEKEEERLSCVL